MDRDFAIDPQDLLRAVDLMSRDFGTREAMNLPGALPEEGTGAHVAME